MSDAPVSWVGRAEAALNRGSATHEDDRVLSGRRPPLLDTEGAKAILAPVLAALVWASAIFREMVVESSLDPIGMLLRLIALGLTLRVLLLGAGFVRRLGIWMNARRYGLALTPDGLVYRTPTHDIAIPKDRIVGVTEHGKWQDRKAGRRWNDVYVVVDPTLGRTHLALPPVFEESSGLLAERLMRWRGPAPDEREVDEPPAQLASRVYDQAADGLAEPGTTVLVHDLGWLKTGPYLVLLVGLIAMDAMARGGAQVWDALEPWMAGALFVALLAVPARWFWMTRRDVSPRKGLAMVLTPAELLIRTRHGILRTRWKSLARVVIEAKTKWSVLEGPHQFRQLVVIRQHEAKIRYDEPYLGLPAEVGKLLLDAYRAGWLPILDEDATDAAVDEEE